MTSALVYGGNVSPPADLPFEDIEAPNLGLVRVRAMMFAERMQFRARVAALRREKADEDAATYAAIPELLEVSVVDATGSPIYSKTHWNQYGATQEATVLELFSSAMRLSGLSSEDAKKN